MDVAVLPALLFGGVIGFWKGLSRDKISGVASIVGGLIMLSLCLTKLPMVQPLKPTLAMLAVSTSLDLFVQERKHLFQVVFGEAGCLNFHGLPREPSLALNVNYTICAFKGF
jgi:hypothetical protein